MERLGAPRLACDAEHLRGADAGTRDVETRGAAAGGGAGTGAEDAARPAGTRLGGGIVAFPVAPAPVVMHRLGGRYRPSRQHAEGGAPHQENRQDRCRQAAANPFQHSCKNGTGRPAGRTANMPE